MINSPRLITEKIGNRKICCEIGSKTGLFFPTQDKREKGGLACEITHWTAIIAKNYLVESVTLIASVPYTICDYV